MDTLRLLSKVTSKCLGCGNPVVVVLVPACYMISDPQVVCSQECAGRYECSMRSYLERQGE